jgi:hypothetical protein
MSNIQFSGIPLITYFKKQRCKRVLSIICLFSFPEFHNRNRISLTAGTLPESLLHSNHGTKCEHGTQNIFKDTMEKKYNVVTRYKEQI